MVSGNCPTCNNFYKNLGAHRCKATKQEGTPTGTESTPTKNIIDTPIIEQEPYKCDITQESEVKDEIPIPKKESSLLSKFKGLFARKPKEKRKISINEIFDNLPKWAIKAKKPWSKPKNPNANWIQIVAFSRTRPPKAVWAEYDGVSISIDDMFFPAPHEIRGEIFPYDMDKGVPLLDNSDQYNDMSYWNKLVERVKNMYFTLGLVTGSGDFTKNIGLILLLVGVCILGVIVNIIMTYNLTNSIASTASQIGNVTYAVQNYMNTHP